MRSETLDKIIFFILERAKCEEDTDKYLEHVLDYCKKDYQQAYIEQNGIELTIDEMQRMFESQRKVHYSSRTFFNQ